MASGRIHTLLKRLFIFDAFTLVTQPIMTKKAIKKLVNDKIKQGYTKQEIYEELKSNFTSNSPDFISAIRFSVPIPARKKYKIIYNIAVLYYSYLFLSSAVNLINIFFSGSTGQIFGGILGIMLYGFMLYSIVVYKGRIYFFVFIFFAVCFCLIGLNLVFQEPSSISTGAIVLVSGLGFTSFTGFFLNRKLTPKEKMTKEIYINELGQKRMRYNYHFEA